MPVVTNSYQFSFGGQSFGGTSSPYQIQSVDGLEGVPPLRVQDDNRGYADGSFTGQDFYSGRTITVNMLVLANGATSAQTNLNTLQNTLKPQQSGTTPLYFIVPPSTEQFINARVRAFRTTIDPDYTYGYIRVQIEFFCPNPFYFDSTLQTASLVVSNPLGRTYNRTYNLTYGGGSLATTTAVTNSGRTTAYPTITLNGPITNPILGNVTQGNYLSFTGTYSNTDSLVVDLYNKLVTLNGVTARNLLTSGSWFSAPVGTSQFYMTGTGTLAGTTTATVSWYNTYV
jgi:phage-related protein